ncbi:PREDICTED: heme-binding protein 2-like [Nelumbo nucifera]|uniref:Heme-binding protein 2-like n=2 Tax=Nelumbo nucifera TaxID=4432 RepID=A0A822YGM3_NELNU|nr:PREDICTED: heme-binding protein 2-like [Nelumbo nucifera]DAD30409.1 TPA_asm: hypothetical protein HUJ06_009260 [Nelumbo nucifera]
MASLIVNGLSLLLLLSPLVAVIAYEKPVNCRSIECAPYEVIHHQNNLEIRSYRNSVWMSTPPINSSSYKEAVGSGFNTLFAYIQGMNHGGTKIDMTAPVLVDIFPSKGPFCNSTFVVHFYVPQKYQKNPPLSDQVHPVKLPKHRYAAVRRFGGFMDDSNIPLQFVFLRKSLKGTPWESAISSRHGGGGGEPQPYSVAGYNSPYEYENRVNEVLLWFGK